MEVSLCPLALYTSAVNAGSPAACQNENPLTDSTFCAIEGTHREANLASDEL